MDQEVYLAKITPVLPEKCPVLYIAIQIRQMCECWMVTDIFDILCLPVTVSGCFSYSPCTQNITDYSEM